MHSKVISFLPTAQSSAWETRVKVGMLLSGVLSIGSCCWGGALYLTPFPSQRLLSVALFALSGTSAAGAITAWGLELTPSPVLSTTLPSRALPNKVSLLYKVLKRHCSEENWKLCGQGYPIASLEEKLKAGKWSEPYLATFFLRLFLSLSEEERVAIGLEFQKYPQKILEEHFGFGKITHTFFEAFAPLKEICNDSFPCRDALVAHFFYLYACTVSCCLGCGAEPPPDLRELCEKMPVRREELLALPQALDALLRQLGSEWRRYFDEELLPFLDALEMQEVALDLRGFVEQIDTQGFGESVAKSLLMSQQMGLLLKDEALYRELLSEGVAFLETLFDEAQIPHEGFCGSSVGKIDLPIQDLALPFLLLLQGGSHLHQLRPWLLAHKEGLFGFSKLGISKEYEKRVPQARLMFFAALQVMGALDLALIHRWPGKSHMLKKVLARLSTAADLATGEKLELGPLNTFLLLGAFGNEEKERRALATGIEVLRSFYSTLFDFDLNSWLSRPQALKDHILKAWETSLQTISKEHPLETEDLLVQSTALDKELALWVSDVKQLFTGELLPFLDAQESGPEIKRLAENTAKILEGALDEAHLLLAPSVKSMGEYALKTALLTPRFEKLLKRQEALQEVADRGVELLVTSLKEASLEWHEFEVVCRQEPEKILKALKMMTWEDMSAMDYLSVLPFHDLLLPLPLLHEATKHLGKVGSWLSNHRDGLFALGKLGIPEEVEQQEMLEKYEAEGKMGLSFGLKLFSGLNSAIMSDFPLKSMGIRLAIKGTLFALKTKVHDPEALRLIRAFSSLLSLFILGVFGSDRAEKDALQKLCARVRSFYQRLYSFDPQKIGTDGAALDAHIKESLASFFLSPLKSL